MDKAIVETKGLFQKEVKFTKEHYESHEESILDYRQSRRVLPIYEPGEVVRGKVRNLMRTAFNFNFASLTFVS